jgi:hypothetical protein
VQKQASEAEEELSPIEFVKPVGLQQIDEKIPQSRIRREFAADCIPIKHISSGV